MQNKSSGQMWFYHAPSKRNDNAETQHVPPASQIPGLAAMDPMDQEAWEREIGLNKKSIRDTDSNYIRLAKQGGRKNLLSFNYKKQSETSENEPAPYPRVDWFDHVSCDEEKDNEILKKSKWYPPEYMVHEEWTDASSNSDDRIDGVTRKKKRAPFYTDNLSVWKRRMEEQERENKLRKKNSRRALPVHRPIKKDNVSFSKLIGGEYGNEWYQNILKKNESNKSKGNSNDMTEYQEIISKKVNPTRKLKPVRLPPIKKQEMQIQNPPFVMQKFANVKSKFASSKTMA